MTGSRPRRTTTWPRALKLKLREWLLKAGHVRRVHIVGCARSGTTMLHYSMIAFADTILIDKETSVRESPTLKESALLCRNGLFGRSPVHFVTKRTYGWFRPDELAQLIDRTPRERIGLINIVRDPRDVLTSTHAGDTTRRFYVEPERWKASIAAADDLFARLDAYPHKLTLRYEDVVNDPAATEQVLSTTFSLTLRPNIDSIGRLKDNLERLEASTRMAKFMQNIRNFDPATIGRWKTDPEKVSYLDGLFTTSEFRDDLRQFIERYDYPM
jgi:hypothetical protein